MSLSADEWAASILDLTVATDSRKEFKQLVAHAITAAVAEMQERCAKVADDMKYYSPEQIAAAIRKVKP